MSAKNCLMLNFLNSVVKNVFFPILMMLIPDYHLQFTFGCQIHFRPVSSGIKNVQNIGSSYDL